MANTAKRIGVVGAGVSGVVAAAHLRAAGLEVIVFERSPVAGGVWVFDRCLPPEPPYPSMRPSLADFTTLSAADRRLLGDVELDFDSMDREIPAILHAPPGPCYEGLSNNVPTTLMELKLNKWKTGTPAIVNHNVLEEYIQDTSSKSGVDKCTLYNTRVERAYKEKSKWYLRTSTLDICEHGEFKTRTNTWEFDALVVATGHYHACRVPNMHGLKHWKRLYPTRIQHSKRYRTPQEYQNKNVLLVGASVSSTDIAKELGPFAKTIYQSSRGGLFDLPPGMLPQNAHRVGEIASFNRSMNSAGSEPHRILAEEQTIPETVTLVDGTIIANIDRVLICTGYHCSFPFLRDYHRDSLSPEDADEAVLVTNGEQIHNLHKDIFYIPDPTLSFVGVPYHVATFTLFEFQAIVISAVYSGKAKLPPEGALRAEYQMRVQDKGFGKAFHSLKGQDVAYANSLVDWINADAGLKGESVIEGHTKAWHAAYEDFRATMMIRSGP